MPDMLVKLYTLPALRPVIEPLYQEGIAVRRALAPERHLVTQWIGEHFDDRWVSEAKVSFSNTPISCFIAVRDLSILGFACYDATAPNFFGPTGVAEDARDKGIGTALLLATLHAQRAQGYGYSVIGGAGPTEFYKKSVGAIPIEGSSPGIYEGFLLANEEDVE